jgi:hypothetical protein
VNEPGALWNVYDKIRFMKREIRTLIIQPSIMPQIAGPKLNVQLEEQKK